MLSMKRDEDEESRNSSQKRRAPLNEPFARLNETASSEGRPRRRRRCAEPRMFARAVSSRRSRCRTRRTDAPPPPRRRPRRRWNDSRANGSRAPTPRGDGGARRGGARGERDPAKRGVPECKRTSCTTLGDYNRYVGDEVPRTWLRRGRGCDGRRSVCFGSVRRRRRRRIARLYFTRLYFTWRAKTRAPFASVFERPARRPDSRGAHPARIDRRTLADPNHAGHVERVYAVPRALARASFRPRFPGGGHAPPASTPSTCRHLARLRDASRRVRARDMARLEHRLGPPPPAGGLRGRRPRRVGAERGGVCARVAIWAGAGHMVFPESAGLDVKSDKSASSAPGADDAMRLLTRLAPVCDHPRYADARAVRVHRRGRRVCGRRRHARRRRRGARRGARAPRARQRRGPSRVRAVRADARDRRHRRGGHLTAVARERGLRANA